MITRDDVKTYLQISGTDKDALIDLLIPGVEAFVESYLQRSLASASHTEYHDGDGQKILLLENFPIVTLTSLQYNSGSLDTPVWSDFTAGTYKPSTEVGKIFFFGAPPRGFQNIKVVYTAGYASIPSDLKIAMIKMVGNWLNNSQSDGVNSESVDGDSISFTTKEVPNDILAILNNYKNYNV